MLDKPQKKSVIELNFLSSNPKHGMVTQNNHLDGGMQWLSGRVINLRLRGQ